MHSVEHNNLCLKLARRPVSSKNITAHYTNFDVLFAKKHVASRCISVQETESRGKHVKTVSMSNYLSHSRSKPPNSNQSKINLNFSFWCGCYSTGLAGGGGVVVYQYTRKKFANTQNSSKYTQNFTQVYFIPEIQRK